MTNAALRLRASVNEYIDKNGLEHVQVTLYDWRILEETSQFLSLSKTQPKRAKVIK